MFYGMILFVFFQLQNKEGDVWLINI